MTVSTVSRHSDVSDLLREGLLAVDFRTSGCIAFLHLCLRCRHELHACDDGRSRTACWVVSRDMV